MTGSPHGSGDQPKSGSADSTVWQQGPPTAGWSVPDARVPPASVSASDPAVFGCRPGGQGHRPSQPTGRGTPAPIVAAAVGAAAIVVPAIGVVVGMVVGGRDHGGVPAADPGPATYSMRAITDACDLVDLTPLTRWASTPHRDPTHEQTPAAGNFGSLHCSASYGNSPGDTFPMNTATMRVRADVVDGSAARKYDHCKRTAAELADKGSEVTSGEFTGIGTRGYWQFEADNFGGIVDAGYVVCVWDGGVAVQVQIHLSREKVSPAVGRDELDSVARSQARKVLDGLRQG